MALAVLGVVLPVAPPAVGGPPEYRLAWQDGFEVFDTDRWDAVTTSVPTNNSRQAYLASQVKVDDGNLIITAEDKPVDRLPYRSGLVETREFRHYGRWEVRAKLPTSAGMWPAIWLLPDTAEHRWPSGGEIDLMENRGNQPTVTSSAFHYGTNPPYRHDFVYGEQQTATLAGANTQYDQGFHTYAVDWTPEYLRFYVDGVNHYTVYDEDVGGFLSQSTQAMRLVINTAVGGTFLPDPDETTVWPQEFRIDSVRVYEPTGERAVARMTNHDFEQHAGSLSAWTVFGNDLFDNPNVRASAEVVRTGNASLKVFGSFRDGRNHSGVCQGITVEPGAKVTASLHSLVRGGDRLVGDNRIALKIDFYSRYGAKYGGDAMVGEEVLWIADATTTPDEWTRNDLQAIAPAGAKEARLAIVFEQPGLDAGAIHVDDIVFKSSPVEPIGGLDPSGRSDGTVWRGEHRSSGHDPAAEVETDRQADRTDALVQRHPFLTQSMPAR